MHWSADQWGLVLPQTDCEPFGFSVDVLARSAMYTISAFPKQSRAHNASAVYCSIGLACSTYTFWQYPLPPSWRQCYTKPVMSVPLCKASERGGILAGCQILIYSLVDVLQLVFNYISHAQGLGILCLLQQKWNHGLKRTEFHCCNALPEGAIMPQ